jgi:hypothetical protein
MPSSPPSLLSRSPFELEDEELLGRPPVGIELSEDDAVVPGLELLDELEERDALDELEAEGIEGEPELEELETEGMDGELELELDDDDDGIDGIEDEELELEDDGIDGEDELLELELEDAVGIDGELELLLWLVSSLHAANTRLSAETVKSALIGLRAAGLFMVLSRELLMVCPCRMRRIVLHQAWILTGPAISRFHPQIRGARTNTTHS